MPSRVLLISYLLPPAGGVGVQRPLSLLRYLPECGCEVVALGARNPVTPNYDPGLAARIPAAVKVYRAWTIEPPHRLRDRLWKQLAARRPAPAAHSAAAAADSAPASGGWKRRLAGWAERLAVPDPQKAWRPLAYRAAEAIVARHRIDTVIVSAPPFSSLAIGVRLKRRFPHIKLISDFRDEWVGFYLKELIPPPSAYRVDVCREEERAAVEASDFVVTVTSTMRDNIRARYPREEECKFLSVINGWDPAMFAGFMPRPAPQGRLQVVYTGTVYANPLYSPLVWAEAIAGLVPEERAQIHTRLVGRVEPGVAERLAALPVAVEMEGFRAQQEALRFMEEADCLLAIVGNPTAMGGKMLEYLASGQPVAALTPPGGEVSRLIEDTRAGFTADIEDPDAIRSLARRLLAWKQEGRPFAPDRAIIERLSRPALTAEFARLTGIGG